MSQWERFKQEIKGDPEAIKTATRAAVLLARRSIKRRRWKEFRSTNKTQCERAADFMAGLTGHKDPLLEAA